MLRRGKLLSIYHLYGEWSSFHIDQYAREETRDFSLGFKSEYRNLDHWLKSLSLKDYIQQPLTPVCYGGIFLTTRHQILKYPSSMYERIAQSLSRGDNIEEGHFAERTWAALLSKPVKPFQIKQMLKLFIKFCKVNLKPGVLCADLSMFASPNA